LIGQAHAILHGIPGAFGVIGGDDDLFHGGRGDLVEVNIRRCRVSGVAP
jgi:hypothetical protein